MKDYTMYTGFYEIPCLTGRKSFYGKAKERVIENGYELKSYETIVCKLVNGKLIRLWNSYSPTTMNHINGFLVFHGMEKIKKADWMTMEVKKEGIEQ